MAAATEGGRPCAKKRPTIRIMQQGSLRFQAAVEILLHIAGDKYIAYKFEKYLKTGSDRAFMGRHLV